MHQSLETFLKTLDTKHNLNLKIELTILKENGYPDFELYINSSKQNFEKKDRIILEKQLPLFDPINIKLELKNKRYNQHKETAVKIDLISIEELDIIPKYQHLAKYQNDHNFNQPVAYLGFNGTWELKIDRPFFQWYHEISGQGILIL